MTCLPRTNPPRLLRYGAPPDHIDHPPARLQPYNDFRSLANPLGRGNLEWSASQLVHQRGR
jgi:hypothetical protein